MIHSTPVSSSKRPRDEENEVSSGYPSGSYDDESDDSFDYSLLSVTNNSEFSFRTAVPVDALRKKKMEQDLLNERRDLFEGVSSESDEFSDDADCEMSPEERNLKDKKEMSAQLRKEWKFAQKNACGPSFVWKSKSVQEKEVNKLADLTYQSFCLDEGEPLNNNDGAEVEIPDDEDDVL